MQNERLKEQIVELQKEINDLVDAHKAESMESKTEVRPLILTINIKFVVEQFGCFWLQTF
jgi:hypothetical protein